MFRIKNGVSILPRLATGIRTLKDKEITFCFYSSPSCDGDPGRKSTPKTRIVSILPRLATGIINCHYVPQLEHVSILPRLATGIEANFRNSVLCMFLFFPVLRRGSE